MQSCRKIPFSSFSPCWWISIPCSPSRSIIPNRIRSFSIQLRTFFPFCPRGWYPPSFHDVALHGFIHHALLHFRYLTLTFWESATWLAHHIVTSCHVLGTDINSVSFLDSRHSPSQFRHPQQCCRIAFTCKSTVTFQAFAPSFSPLRFSQQRCHV